MSARRPHTPFRGWLRTHDPGLRALRRAGRTAIVMPAMFALGDKVIGNPIVATFAAFGSFAMLLLVDFAGPIRRRLRAQALLAVVCGLFKNTCDAAAFRREMNEGYPRAVEWAHRTYS